MIETRVNFPSAGGVTFVQFLPPSRDTWTSPSSEPAHNTSGLRGDSANAKIVAYHSVPVMSYVIGPPAGPSVRGSCSVRSGLIGCQLSPSFVDLNTRLAVVYSTRGSCIEYTIGYVHWNRFGTSSAGHPS